jgi:import inner membrane translocase subunit TIM50
VVGYPNFELVIYTSESPMSAIGVIDQINTKHRIMYHLFRDCTKYVNGHHVKDLGRLNRDLTKVIFIDFDPESAKFNPENMLRVPKWDGDSNDTALVDLAELLKSELFCW